MAVNQSYEKFLKRSIPFASLCLDQTNRNIMIDSIVSNVYIKIADSAVSGQTILSEVATKIGCEATELVILDSKLVEVSDDKGKNRAQWHAIFEKCIFVDLEYWKVPSRKLYISKKSEYDDVMKVKSRKRLSLNRRKKRPISYEEPLSDEETTATGIHRIESKLNKVKEHRI